MSATIPWTWVVQKETTNQAEANRILIEAIWQMDGPGQLQCIQQVKESIGGGASWEEVLVHYPGAEWFGPDSRWTPALVNGRHKFLSVIPELAAIS